MLDNPDLIASLIGFDGLIAVAVTALAVKLLPENRSAQLAALKDRIDSRLTQVESAVGYVKGRIDGLENILSDGRVTPAEVATIREETTVLKDMLSGLVGGLKRDEPG